MFRVTVRAFADTTIHQAGVHGRHPELVEITMNGVKKVEQLETKSWEVER